MNNVAKNAGVCGVFSSAWFSLAWFTFDSKRHLLLFSATERGRPRTECAVGKLPGQG